MRTDCQMSQGFRSRMRVCLWQVKTNWRDVMSFEFPAQGVARQRVGEFHMSRVLNFPPKEVLLSNKRMNFIGPWKIWNFDGVCKSVEASSSVRTDVFFGAPNDWSKNSYLTCSRTLIPSNAERKTWTSFQKTRFWERLVKNRRSADEKAENWGREFAAHIRYPSLVQNSPWNPSGLMPRHTVQSSSLKKYRFMQNL